MVMREGMGTPAIDSAESRYRKARRHYWDREAVNGKQRPDWRSYYHERLSRILAQLVPPGSRVLELGCGQGALLNALKPSQGVGIDFSPEMIRRARERFPTLTFMEADVHDLPELDPFEFVILSDLINDLWDVQTLFQALHRVTTCRSRVIINTYSRLWEFPLWLVRKVGLGRPVLFQNWLTLEDVANMLYLADFEMIRTWDEILWPIRSPIIAPFMNRFLAKIWPFRWFDLTHFIVARPNPKRETPRKKPSVSVIVPARNEVGNIEDIFRRLPEMDGGTELIFVEGHSTDDTYAVIEHAMKVHSQRHAKLFRQEGRGKGDAVRLGFLHAEGAILMILDADLSTPPEELPRFCEILTSGKGEFANGVRLVYPMEGEAMRFLNLIGNKFFSLAFTWLLGQPVKDTLCGTKALWKRDYERIAANRVYFGDFDPFGDFDLLFGAAKLSLKICDVPVRYRERTYGATNIHRWSHGWLLLKMVLFATRKIKFV